MDPLVHLKPDASLGLSPLFPLLLWEIVKGVFLSTLNELMVWSHLEHSKALRWYSNQDRTFSPMHEENLLHSKWSMYKQSTWNPGSTWCSHGDMVFPVPVCELAEVKSSVAGSRLLSKKGWSYLCVHSLRNLEHHWRLTPFCCSLQEERAVHQSQTGPLALVLRA